MFKLAACPHCKLALRYMEELTEARAALFRRVPARTG